MPMQVREKTFDAVGGLKDHIQALKEMIIYPLMYKELFQSHGIEAPRGVLFHGPPGTGKTLVAGAVAAECSRCTNRRVAFYMRKGADCLNKYVGESEKHLQNLFNQAQSTRPSIIFFDEIDGLVPTRSETQEQVHASVVSTFLALMDGLDSKSEVFVIGATNRIDMIDPALRRPGRFDRELYFPLPPIESRFQIFQIHTKHWMAKPKHEFLLKLASECSGYCGADIQSLCSQAVMESFRRNYPQVADTNRKLHVNFNLKVTQEDFYAAKDKVMPASHRLLTIPARPLSPELEPLLQRTLSYCLEFIEKFCPFKFIHRNHPNLTKNKSITCPRLLLTRSGDQGHIPFLASAILHSFDHLPVTVIDLPTINDQNFRSTDSSSLVQKIKQARQSMPGIIFLPDIGTWWELIDETGRMVLTASLEKLDSNTTTQLFLLATSNTTSYDDLSAEIQKIFPKNRVLLVKGPAQEERYNFFAQLLTKVYKEPAIPEIIKREPQSDPESDVEENRKAKTKRRRSRRQKGLDVEFLGIVYDSKPRIGSYFRKTVEEKSSRRRNLSQTQGSNFENQSFPFPIKRQSETDLWNHSLHKKPKLEVVDHPNTPKDMGILPMHSNKDIELKVEELTKLCVEVTYNSTTEVVIKLYEQLEIVLLRFASVWDKSYLLQELEREITFFNPS